MKISPSAQDVCNTFKGVWISLNLKGDGVTRFIRWMIEEEVRNHPLVGAGSSGPFRYCSFFEPKEATRVRAWCKVNKIAVTTGFKEEG